MCGVATIIRAMKLESVGILIDMRPLNERDSLSRIFTDDYGVMVGVMRGAVVAKKNKPLVGQVGAVSWNARLDSQLGVFHWDAERNLAAPLMMQQDRLGLMNAAFGLICALLPERECYADLYSETLEMLCGVAQSAQPRAVYLDWECKLLRAVGFAIDVSACAGCGRTDNLMYLSPRTCRAVCRDCGAPYAARLYRLPITLLTTGRLLDAVCQNVGAKMPRARRVLMDTE